eukprot:5422773-Prymnesium_polylepis.3
MKEGVRPCGLDVPTAEAGRPALLPMRARTGESRQAAHGRADQVRARAVEHDADKGGVQHGDWRRRRSG